MSAGTAPISRRHFLEGVFSAGAFVLCAGALPRGAWAEIVNPALPLATTAFHPGIWLGIEPDGTVLIVAARSEMGTGIRTALPRVVADELEADWRRVRIVQAIGDAKYGSQDTDGSHSIRSFFEVMRTAGATARTMLTQAAAQRWGVSAEECEARFHAVHRGAAAAGGDPALGYGELAAAAARLPVPSRESLRFKPRSAWRYIGKDAAAYDLEAICTGEAGYGMDAHAPGMLYAAVAHPPVLGGQVASFDPKPALAVAGVRRVVPLPPLQFPAAMQPLGGVAVVADNTWAAFEGRRKLHVEWNDGPNAGYDSAAYRQQLEATARQPGKVARDNGNALAELANGGRIVEAAYYAPHLAHASMEPPVALADVRDGRVEAWVPTQDPQGAQESIAKAIGVPKENVVCHVPLLGGAFGRKSMHDFAVEAALLSQAAGRPVKVVWSREDDIRFDYYHSVAAMVLQAKLGANGMPTAWLGRSVFPPIGSIFNADNEYGSGGELGMGFTDVPFAIPNVRVENGPARAHLRIGWLRSVANIYHAFAVQSFAGELAHAAGRDPLEYLLALLGPDRILDPALLSVAYRPSPRAEKNPYPIDIARYRRVVELAAERAGWSRFRSGQGRGIGLAVHRSFLTYVATVVQVHLDPHGHVRIDRVDTALDAGTVVNPINVRAQFEGAAVFGASLALYGEITAKNGAVVQSNFNDYPVCRMNQAPAEVHVHIVPSEAPPAGVGEPGVPPFAPALCNAVFAATGRRVRALPLVHAGLA